MLNGYFIFFSLKIIGCYVIENYRLIFVNLVLLRDEIEVRIVKFIYKFKKIGYDIGILKS